MANIRDALIWQSPSLELQRTAAVEIVRLDNELKLMEGVITELNAKLTKLKAALYANDEVLQELPNDEYKIVLEVFGGS